MLLKLNEAAFNNNFPSQAFYMLFDEVNLMNAKEICQWIMEANFQSEEKPEVLNLVINSPGGDLNAAFAVIDVIRGSSIPVRTIGLGQISSAGLMIFLSGQKGMRMLTKNTSIMSHVFSWGSHGKEHELFAVVKEFDLTSKRMIEHYRKCTKLKTDKEIRKYLLPQVDVFLDSDEALKFGICDQVVTLK